MGVEEFRHCFGGEIVRKQTHGETQIICDDNIKMDFKEIVSECVDGIY